ncbi:MAG: PUA domain-containing protein [Candidatus Heimdallarchaeaceae archaeon]
MTEITESKLLATQYAYEESLIAHWLKYFNTKIIQSYLKRLRLPAKSLWIQINTARADVDSILESLEELDFNVQTNPYFEDILEVEIEKHDIYLDEKDYPAIIVDRESASGIVLGKDVNTSAVIAADEFKANDTIKIIDRTGYVLAKAKAQVNSNEIASLRQQVVAKVLQSRAKIPPLTELRYYRAGLFTVLSPTQIFAIQSMYMEEKDNILVVSPDRGEVATTIAQLTNYNTPITVIAQNQQHARALRKQVNRMKAKSIRIIVNGFYEFIKQHHDITYTSAYIELPNSRTAIMPTLNSNLTIKRLRRLVKRQKNILTYTFRCLHPNASITYVNHSLDPLENEINYRDIVTKTYYETQSFPNSIRKLKVSEFSTIRELKTDILNDIKFHLKVGTLFIDPLKVQNSGGFIAKFKYTPQRDKKPKLY